LFGAKETLGSGWCFCPFGKQAVIADASIVLNALPENGNGSLLAWIL